MDDAAAIRELWTDLKRRLETGQTVSDGIARAVPHGGTFRVENTKTHETVICNSAGEAARYFISLLRQT